MAALFFYSHLCSNKRLYFYLHEKNPERSRQLRTRSRSGLIKKNGEQGVCPLPLCSSVCSVSKTFGLLLFQVFDSQQVEDLRSSPVSSLRLSTSRSLMASLISGIQPSITRSLMASCVSGLTTLHRLKPDGFLCFGSYDPPQVEA